MLNRLYLAQNEKALKTNDCKSSPELRVTENSSLRLSSLKLGL